MPGILKIIYENKYIRFFAAMGIYLLLISYGLKRNNEYFYLLPLGLIIVAIAVHNFKHLWYLLLLLTPLSIDMGEMIPGAGISVPSDPLCVILTGFVAIEVIRKRKVLICFQHPTFLMILIYLSWMFIVTISSVDPVVSLKKDIVWIWSLGGFYLISILIFSRPKNIVYFFTTVGVGFAISISLVILNYVISGRNPFGLRFNPRPYFRDHTLLGAYTAMLVPMFVLFIWKGHFSRSFKWVNVVLLAFNLIGLYFSYSRGGWASCVIGLIFVMILLNWSKIRKYWVIALAVLVIGGVGAFDVLGTSDKEDAVSRKDLMSHVKSMTNFKSDNSNLERVNRWQAALSMYRKKPITGYGPGTYEANYAPHQRVVYRTPISTNHGDVGNAHNEVLLALSETGLIGGILTAVFLILPIVYGIRGYFRAPGRNVSILYLGSAAGLLIYLVHSLVNNFLDQDKMLLIYLGMVAIIAALDLYKHYWEKEGENLTLM